MKKLSIIGILATASVLLALTGCPNTSDSDDDDLPTVDVTGIVSGVVLEAGSSVYTPVKGASVKMGKYSATTNDNGVWSISGVTPNYNSVTGPAFGNGYTAVITRDGYTPTTVSGIWVNAHQYVDDDPYNEIAIANDLIQVIDDYSDNLDNLTNLTIEGSGVTATENGVTLSLTDLGDNVSTLASAMSHVSYSYSVSTSIVRMAPLNCSLTGSISICDLPVDATGDKVVATAPAGMPVQIEDSASGYIYGKTTTDANGAFTISKLPSQTQMVLVVPGFNASLNGSTHYYSTYFDGTTYHSAWLDEHTSTPSLLTIDRLVSNTDKTDARALLYAQPTKIIVTANNVGSETEDTPLLLTDSLTFTFDRAMTSLTPEFRNASNVPVTVATDITWDADRTTATIAPSTGKFDTAVKSIVLAGEAADGCETFEKSIYEIVFDSTIKVTSTNVGENTIQDPLSRTTPLTFTFDRPMNSLGVSFSDGVNVVSQATGITWSADHLTATVFSKDGDGKFDASIAEIGISGEAEDGSTQFETSVYDVKFINFEVLSVSIIASSDVPADAVTVPSSAARASVPVTSANSLALTFSDSISAAAVYMGTADEYGKRSLMTVSTKDKVLYIPFGTMVDAASGDLNIWGTVESTHNDSSECAFGGATWKLDTYFAYPTYRIVSSNVYEKTGALEGTNDDISDTLKPDEAIDITFDGEFPAGSSVTAELYKSGEINIVDNALPVTTSISGTTVTIKPTTVLEPQTYYLALAVTNESSTLFTTMNKMFADDGYEAKISDTAAHVGYITVNVSTPVVMVGNNYTTLEEIDADGAAILQFDQDITGCTAFMTTSNAVGTSMTYTAAQKDEKDAGTLIPAAFSVDSAENVLTITPSAVLSESLAGNSVYVYVYSADGSLLENVYNSTDYFTVDISSTAVDPTSVGSKLSLNTTDVDSGTALEFDVTPFYLSEDNGAVTYTLKKQTYNALGDLSDWTDVATVPVSSLQFVRDDEITVSAAPGADDYWYGSDHSAKYCLAATINNMEYMSDAVSVTDDVHPVYNGYVSAGSGSLTTVSSGATYGAAVAVSDGTTVFTIDGGETVKAMSVSSSITDSGVTVDKAYTATGITVTVTCNSGASIATGEYLLISFTDMSGNAAVISRSGTPNNTYRISFN